MHSQEKNSSSTNQSKDSTTGSAKPRSDTAAKPPVGEGERKAEPASRTPSHTEGQKDAHKTPTAPLEGKGSGQHPHAPGKSGTTH